MMKYKLTDEDMNFLNKIEDDLGVVVKVNVLRAQKRSIVDEVEKIYNKFNKKLGNKNCGSCIYEMYHFIATEYFAELEKSVKKEIMEVDSAVIHSNVEKRMEKTMNKRKERMKKKKDV